MKVEYYVAFPALNFDEAVRAFRKWHGVDPQTVKVIGDWDNPPKGVSPQPGRLGNWYEFMFLEEELE
jgi:hypothetical protein